MDEENNGPKQVDELITDTSIIDTLKKQADDYLKGWQTERANLLNYQRDENERLSKMLIQSEKKMILEILPIVDNFDLMIKNLEKTNDEYFNGLKLIYDQCVAFLNKYNCRSFDSLNQIFDPKMHEAVEIIQDENKINNIISEEIQKGYLLNDQVLRPAKVKVIINK